MREDRLYARLGILCTLILTAPAAILVVRQARSAVAARRARYVRVGAQPSPADLRMIYDYTR